jgi:hypothetical protein
VEENCGRNWKCLIYDLNDYMNTMIFTKTPIIVYHKITKIIVQTKGIKLTNNCGNFLSHKGTKTTKEELCGLCVFVKNNN